MNRSIQVSTILLFIFLISVKYTICLDVEKLIEEIVSSRIKRDVEDVSNIWMEYEFNTGAGNREELVVTDVSIHEFIDLPKTETKWQYLNIIGSDYLFRAEESTLYFYEVDLDKICITYSSSFDAEGNIISYRAVSLQPEMHLIVLCVESRNATTLQWYKLEDKNVFKHFWTWPVLKRIKDIQFIQREKSYQLLLLNDEEINFGARYSAIDVYGFYINFPKSINLFWLYDEIPKLKTDRIQVCPIHETASLAVQGSNHVLFYEDRNVTEGSSFRELQSIKSYNLSNFVCFESGYLSFLAISGPEAGLFHFVNDEFEFNTESESNFDYPEIAWIESIRPDSYREESLLLMQLKNSTVLALTWQGFSFKGTHLPNKNLDQFDLSKIIPIPKYGFMHGNQLVKIHTQLKDVIHPVQYSTQRLLLLQSLLEETLNHQDRILNETEARIEKSYLKNPVTGFWNISVADVTNATFSKNVSYGQITIGNANLTPEDVGFDIDNFEKRLKSVKQKLIEIDSNLAKANQLDFDSDVEIFGNINFAGSLTVENLTAEFINDVSMNDSSSHDDSTTIEETFDFIQAENLTVYSVNGIPFKDILFSDAIKDYRHVNFSEINKVEVNGDISFENINGIDWNILMRDIVWKDEPKVIPGNTVIEGLTVLGLMNGFNFSERVSDTILNDDTDIVLEGHKVFESNVSCYQLEVDSLNGRPTENILDPKKEQTLLGPIIINGSITVSNDFNVTGKINHIPFHNFTNRFKFVGNNTYEFGDGINFPGNVTVENLQTTGLIDGKNFTEFLDTVIYKDKDNLTITGTKIFKNKVIFNNSFIANDRLNDIDLKRFYEKAVFIDKPFSIKSKVIFKDALKVEKDIIVKKNLEAKSIMGIDLDDLKKNVMNVNRPIHIDGTVTFSKVDFLSNIKVDMINDIDMKLLLPLKTDQTIPVEVLRCRNVIAKKVQIFGRVNNENLKEIQENTFMLTGDQTITGNFNFYGNVVARDFKARLINGIDPTRFIPLNTTKPIIGNFAFEKPVVFNQNLQVFGYLNGINPNRWAAEAVTTNNSSKQIISGKWTVHGNVYFKNGAEGSDILNGTNITDLSNVLAKKHLEMHEILAETKANLHSVCEDLNHLKHYAERQIYQFNVFDYLQVIEYNSSIVSSHYFELNDLDYLTLSYDDCQMHMYQFTGETFELVANVIDFGVIEKWSTFERDQTLYFLTLGKNSCGRSSVNLWKLKDDDFQFVLDLGHKINRRDVNQDMFLTMVAEIERLKSSDKMNEEFEKSLSTLTSDNTKLYLNNELLKSVNNVYEFEVESQDTSLGKYFGKPEILKFNAGFLKKEMYLYYDEELSRNRIFICSKDAKRGKILQTITAHRPASFVVFSFEGSFETLLIFMENRKILTIYEYKGIQGFVHRDSIKINANKLFSFKIRKYTNFAKRRCLGLVDDNTLSILEAEMYGEKLDIDTLTCSGN
ncbi:uncharacterized protein LOC108623376 [Ceratina calcarata]|uniref:Uncharacterized protein LOC108623376 n=1 Tax=Ceratina calcarata TaxID=156304 RepID=A0AAJ7IUF2_9HYME|nr:uncharacterized protein LOC108623376 [Ceratina calcarata]